jgi:hypothetical protein
LEGFYPALEEESSYILKRGAERAERFFSGEDFNA